MELSCINSHILNRNPCIVPTDSCQYTALLVSIWGLSWGHCQAATTIYFIFVWVYINNSCRTFSFHFRSNSKKDQISLKHFTQTAEEALFYHHLFLLPHPSFALYGFSMLCVKETRRLCHASLNHQRGEGCASIIFHADLTYLPRLLFKTCHCRCIGLRLTAAAEILTAQSLYIFCILYTQTHWTNYVKKKNHKDSLLKSPQSRQM